MGSPVPVVFRARASLHAAESCNRGCWKASSSLKRVFVTNRHHFTGAEALCLTLRDRTRILSEQHCERALRPDCSVNTSCQARAACSKLDMAAYIRADSRSLESASISSCV